MNDLLTAVDADDAEPADAQAGSEVPPIRPNDGERLMRFWRQRDEAALAELIELHGGMVWGVCAQILRHREDVEDAFQATFLILARKAKSIKAADSAAGWLYRVAFRTALLARTRRQRREHEPLLVEPASELDQLETISRNEQCRLLLEELNSLPLQYRQPLVLCYLEGRSRSEAADELGITPQSVKGRLARGTRMLRSRLVSRGAALSTTMAALSAAMATTQAAAPPALISKTAALGAGFAMKLTGAGAKANALKSGATVLAEKGILSMTLIAAAKPAVAVLGVCLTAGMLAVASADAPEAGSGSSGHSPLSAAIMLLAGEDVEAAADEVTAELAPSEPAAEEERAAIAEAPRAGGEPSSQAAAGSSPSSADNLFAPRAVIINAAPVAPSLPGAPVPPPAAPATAAAFAQITNDGWQPLPDTTARIAQATMALEPINLKFRDASAVPASTASEQALRLQGEYWSLKSNGLKKKAESLTVKAQSLQASNGSKSEVLAAQAEAELTLAEVKLCEINSLQIADQLRALDASRLKENSSGVQVSMLQKLLNERLKPSPGLDVDGDFGPLTAEAVKSFQKNNSLQETGVVDEKTAAALGLSLGGADVLKPNFIYSNRRSFELPLKGLTSVRLPLEASKVKERMLMQAQAAAKAAGAAGGGARATEMRLPEELRAQADEQRQRADEQRRFLEEQWNKAEMEKLRVEEKLQEMRTMVKNLEEQLKGAEGQQK